MDKYMGYVSPSLSGQNTISSKLKREGLIFSVATPRIHSTFAQYKHTSYGNMHTHTACNKYINKSRFGGLNPDRPRP